MKQWVYKAQDEYKGLFSLLYLSLWTRERAYGGDKELMWGLNFPVIEP